MRSLYQICLLSLITAMAAQANCVGCWAARHRFDNKKAKREESYEPRERIARERTVPASYTESSDAQRIRKTKREENCDCVEVKRAR